MPVDDLAAFEVLAASDGPEAGNYTADSGTHADTAATWTEAVATLWRTPPPRLIVAYRGGAAFRIVGGAGLAIVPDVSGSPDRIEVYRCRADTIILPTTGYRWIPASPTIAADNPLPGVAMETVDAYVLSAESVRQSTPSGNAPRWLSRIGEIAPVDNPQPERHRWRWLVSHASQAASSEAFPLDHRIGGPREMRAAGRLSLRVIGPAAGSVPPQWRSFRLAGDSPLTAAAAVPSSVVIPASGWMFQSETEPLLASQRFLSVDR